ncbi:hypothetical protein ACIQXF_07670 [Lysinibacillus sp. NPDC097231]
MRKQAAATYVYCAKAKRQQQNVQSERKSTPRYGDELLLVNKLDSHQ